mmetsp:Transcript_33206/g.49192  ORF Transcript_33206/g.49192 Transcript_33206/m.49192 type:complete len:176 (-) Transcript_33206:109-636(-)|eukprot:CAMPEP_0194047892 /NCGR_PEP_ID=MMETSP0009_2-20130614/26039_1 /TAXON_ID=210454 /ORGANISM="Grammatophora oceanica, Strain CCMP 410" /LENGTH=175 /DNA_ID=CAMNT_0038693635 /DNA_START=224 /DNA_END=751 /DNA_ORIENTATION=+
MSVDTSSYKVCSVLNIEDCGKSKGKTLRACKVDVGNGEELTVVTAAPNVRGGSRVVVAPVGSMVLDEEGEEMEIKKTAVGGVMSEGMFCDSRMLGWSGGGVGIAAQVPDSCPLGSVPPKTKPGRPDDNKTADAGGGSYEGLFEKKLTKEEKKKIAEERRKAKKAAKEAKKAAESS